MKLRTAPMNIVALPSKQKWVTEVTYILTQQGWTYLSIIKDLYDGLLYRWAGLFTEQFHCPGDCDCQMD